MFYGSGSSVIDSAEFVPNSIIVPELLLIDITLKNQLITCVFVNSLASKADGTKEIVFW